MKYKGKITRSMPSSCDGDIIRIELQDKNSGEVVTRIEMGVEEFGYMVCGLSRQECEFEVYNNIDLIGKTKEVKHERIDISGITTNPREKFYEEMKEIVKSYEIEGWKVVERDIRSWNHHKSTNTLYDVGFERYI